MASLTIAACSRLAARRAAALLAVALLAGCTIEVGPPPELDPPLVPETAKAPPQPSEPQPWSRGLDLQSVPVAADREQMTEGLVAGEVEVGYSGERLTFESAFDPEKPPSQAELIRKQAQQRAAAAGLPPPPQVAAVPVTEVDSQALPPEGEAVPPARRESRLPPPKLPPEPAQPAETAETAETAAGDPAATQAVADADSTSAAAPVSQSSADEAWARRQSRLPAPPKFPPLPAEPAPPAQAAEVPEPPAPDVPGPAGSDQIASAAAFAVEAWDAPTGTILVQVAAVPDGREVAHEWERLRALYPQVLKPLRLVVDEAKLGERGVFYRVQAGGFGSREGASAACDSLISEGQACFVVVR